ncbi:MAG TPA: DUF3822 family protein [Saprospiraceae bacterium]|nr:DUF3822 family protein [Saprospiraceae bacterium]
MIEESISKDSIKASDLINSDLFISFNGTQSKLSVRKKDGILGNFQEWTFKESENILDLLSLGNADLEICKSIHLLTHFDQYTLIPAKFYDNSHNKDFLAQLSVLDNTLPIRADFIELVNAFIVYQLSSNELEFLKIWPKQTKVHHHAAIFIQYQLERIRSNKPEVYIHFEENNFNCIIFIDKQLVYSNNQGFYSASDAIYFILAIFQQLQLNTNEEPVIISGRIMPFSDLHNSILRFIKNVQWFTTTEFKSNIIEDSNFPHLFSDLIRLSACEL